MAKKIEDLLLNVVSYNVSKLPSGIGESVEDQKLKKSIKELFSKKSLTLKLVGDEFHKDLVLYFDIIDSIEVCKVIHAWITRFIMDPRTKVAENGLSSKENGLEYFSAKVDASAIISTDPLKTSAVTYSQVIPKSTGSNVDVGNGLMLYKVEFASVIRSFSKGTVTKIKGEKNA